MDTVSKIVFLNLIYFVAARTAVTIDAFECEKNAEAEKQPNYALLSDNYGYFQLSLMILSIACLSIFLNRRKVWLIQDGKLIKCRDPGANLTIPAGVTSIGDEAFEDCINLTSIRIPSSVNAIGYGAFKRCHNLKSIILPEGISCIRGETFMGCINLTSIRIPSSVTHIWLGAFMGCRSLTSIILPEGITEIGDWTFCECRNLTSITIPSSVTHFGEVVFALCSPQLLTNVCRYPIVFENFEMHQREYQATVHPFVTEKLASLRARKVELEHNNPHAIFDITDPEEAKLCFYIIRNLIRRHDAVLLDDLRFLIQIPAVRALLHTRVMAGESNELLQLAMSIDNQEAAQILLSVPAVHDLAAANDFYRNRARGHLDLRALAQNRESTQTLFKYCDDHPEEIIASSENGIGSFQG